ncbi:GAF domain-containing protein [Planobispora takensis]|uniref:GAF domain-containing protein n=1 Tax=Planobispora takensis TaxID=1367882 RepID=A0A8J3SW45_9ACTN|nr:GAF domain-containing protein [Planobispora takensis]GIH99865.1 hypothetical protein Pta02_18740 [Planobispora takensis]
MNTDLTALTGLERLTEVASYDLADPGLRAALDTITRRTAERLGQPISLVTVLLDSVQLFAGTHGLPDSWITELGGTPGEWAFCAEVVRSGRPYTVTDLSADPVQHDNPMVVVEGARSYAGVPLIAPGGQILGGHCVIGVEPHEYGEADVEVLRETAGEIVRLLQRYRHTVPEAAACG